MATAAAAFPKAAPPAVGPANVNTKASISNAVNKKNEKFALALYDFESEEPSDLPFKANERIKIVDQSDPNWYVCRVRIFVFPPFPLGDPRSLRCLRSSLRWRGELNGKQGSFPANYVEVQAVGTSPYLLIDDASFFRPSAHE
jgi:hypothetical protein